MGGDWAFCGWEKYKYLSSAALKTGVAISGLAMFLLLDIIQCI